MQILSCIRWPSTIAELDYSGLDWWTGLVDWTDRLTLKLILCFITTRGAVWKPCSLLSVNPCANNLLH